MAQHSGDRWLMLYSPDKLIQELEAAADRMAFLMGHRPCPLLGPHDGWRSVQMFQGGSRLNYKLVGWSWMTNPANTSRFGRTVESALSAIHDETLAARWQVPAA